MNCQKRHEVSKRKKKMNDMGQFKNHMKFYGDELAKLLK